MFCVDGASEHLKKCCTMWPKLGDVHRSSLVRPVISSLGTDEGVVVACGLELKKICGWFLDKVSGCTLRTLGT